MFSNLLCLGDWLSSSRAITRFRVSISGLPSLRRDANRMSRVNPYEVIMSSSATHDSRLNAHFEAVLAGEIPMEV
jgi:hypothetical protein